MAPSNMRVLAIAGANGGVIHDTLRRPEQVVSSMKARGNRRRNRDDPSSPDSVTSDHEHIEQHHE